MLGKAAIGGIALLMNVALATTPQQAAQRWAQFSGGLTAKIVYGQGGQVRVLDLKTGTTAAIANWKPGTAGHSLGSLRWSPNGARIMLHNADSVNVMNADGSKMKRIFLGHQCSDLIWGDWKGDSAIVYSTGDAKKVVQTQVTPENGPGATTILVNDAPKGPCYSSVGVDGEFLAYNDLEGNSGTGGYHRPLMKNLRTGVVKTLIPNSSDMCQLTVIPDSRYKALGQEESHSVPGSIFDTLGNAVEKLPKIGSYDQRGYSWSNQLEYFISQGEETAPTNDWTWIRSWSRRSQGANILVSDTGSLDMRYPDLWIGSTTGAGKAGYGSVPEPMRSLNRAELLSKMTHGNFRVFSVTGSMFSPRSAGAMPSGLYIVRIDGQSPTLVLVPEE
jgi:hypothetical protein